MGWLAAPGAEAGGVQSPALGVDAGGVHIPSLYEDAGGVACPALGDDAGGVHSPLLYEAAGAVESPAPTEEAGWLATMGEDDGVCAQGGIQDMAGSFLPICAVVAIEVGWLATTVAALAAG